MARLKKQKTKVLVCMSGGVDSSVAAALLLAQGYDVTGAFMVNYESGRAPVGDAGCWLPEYRDALRVAAALGIPLLKLDFVKEYEKKVIAYMFAEYRKGRTPNPDVLCNTFIKFGVWLDWATKHGFEKIATGHYANLRNTNHTNVRKNNEYRLMMAKDTNKDQTYFLHQLNQKQLSQVLFPIGEYTKPQVRGLAKKFKLPTANKEESMGICFVGEVPMKEFIQTRITPKRGRITQSDGTVLGEHEGLAFYTIGQRHLSIASQIKNVNDHTKPLFVVDKNFKKNELIVGFDTDPLLYKNEIKVSGVHFTSEHPPEFPISCEVRLRHRQSLQKAVLQRKNKKEAVLEFQKSQRAPTPGQFAVFYKDGECLGGGVIA